MKTADEYLEDIAFMSALTGDEDLHDSALEALYLVQTKRFREENDILHHARGQRVQMAKNNNNDDGEETVDTEFKRQQLLPLNYIKQQLGVTGRCPVIGVVGERRRGKTTVAKAVASWAIANGFSVMVRTTNERTARAWGEDGIVHGNTWLSMTQSPRILHIFDDVDHQGDGDAWAAVARIRRDDAAVLLTFQELPPATATNNTKIDFIVRLQGRGEEPRLDLVETTAE